MPDNSGAVNLGDLSQEQQEAVERLAEQNGSYPGDKNPEENKRKVLTAFLVLVDYDGSVEVATFDDDDLLLQHAPTGDLVSGACHNVIQSLQAQEVAMMTARATVQTMVEQTRAIAEQQAAAQMAKDLGLKR